MTNIPEVPDVMIETRLLFKKKDVLPSLVLDVINTDPEAGGQIESLELATRLTTEGYLSLDANSSLTRAALENLTKITDWTIVKIYDAIRVPIAITLAGYPGELLELDERGAHRDQI